MSLPPAPPPRGILDLIQDHKGWVLFVAVVAVVAVALIKPDGGGGGGTDTRPGSAAVYSQIAAETDCAELQATFDRAAANNDTAAPGSAEQDWTLGYMQAADTRMEAIGCYG